MLTIMRLFDLHLPAHRCLSYRQRNVVAAESAMAGEDSCSWQLCWPSELCL